ncbi:MFS transporter [Candidimonas nitroreducens]|uniref:MFS transporter n=1 Tax=Candidimonas nitroreducens TaxID=683354 RepID=A0A225MAY0_9BURK|nr:MFS transporter [Candidimonas nitroreducens]OWT56741.1 MFS transporter [Candidimonas nitroreducens]
MIAAEKVDVAEQVYGDAGQQELDATFRKVLKRIVLLLVVSYVVAFLDRINIGFAKLQLQGEIGITDIQYGFAAGIFFLGYVLFEIPSNIWLERIGARKTLLRIMVSWGVVAAATAFVKTPEQLYVLRFLLGVLEAGFFPGIILYLSYWFPASQRGRATGLFYTAPMIAGLIGGPLSGTLISSLHQVGGLSGWQWCLLIEGIPAIVLGFACYYLLADKPEEAKWLTDREKHLVSVAIAREFHDKDQGHAHGDHTSVAGIMAMLRNPRIYLLAFLYFSVVTGGYALNFWIPTMIRTLGIKDVFDIGLYTMLPFLLSLIAIVLVSRSSDKFQERRWHYSIPAVVGALALIATTSPNLSFISALVLLSVGFAGINVAIALFWTIPPSYLRADCAAVGLATISSIGAISGFVGPYLIGWARSATGSNANALYLIGLLVVVAAVLMVVFVPRSVLARSA